MASKARVYAQIETELAETIGQQCKTLGITKQEFMARAVIAELGRLDVRMLVKLTEEALDKMQAERDAAHKVIKSTEVDRDKMQSARDKARKDYQIACEWRNRYKAERNTYQSKHNQAVKERDGYKEEWNDMQSDLSHANAVIQAYENQSWLARLFGIKPKVPDYPTTETAVSHSIL